jgi:hypothetical protein
MIAMSSMASAWKIYRTRFLIKARQLDSPLVFIDPLGREHNGQKGDYLVETSDGLQRIAPREIFEDIYVPMDQVRQSDIPRTGPCTRSMSDSQLLPRESSAPQGPFPASSRSARRAGTLRTDQFQTALNSALGRDPARRLRGDSV